MEIEDNKQFISNFPCITYQLMSLYNIFVSQEANKFPFSWYGVKKMVEKSVTSVDTLDFIEYFERLR